MDKELTAETVPATKPKTARKKTSLAKKTTEAKPAAPKKAAPKVVEKKKYAKDDLISCTSVFPGSCVLIGKRTKTQYVWDAMGEEQEVFYQDLQAEILNKRSSFVYDPLIIINDPDVYEGKSAIADLYKHVYFMDEIKDLLEGEDTATIKTVLRSMPKGVLESVKSIIASLIQDGDVTSYRSVKAVDDELGTDIAKQFELFG